MRIAGERLIGKLKTKYLLILIAMLTIMLYILNIWFQKYR